jgi:hypothetical protein
LVGPNQSNDEKLTTHRINTNFPISSASIVDPYIAMVTQNGRLLLYKVEYSPSVHLQQVSFLRVLSEIICFDLDYGRRFG